MDFGNLKSKKINDVSRLIEKGQICPEELTCFYLKKIIYLVNNLTSLLYQKANKTN